MATKIGINGFGRIGRLTARTIMQRHAGELEIVAINDLATTETNARLFKYDSNYGIYVGEVKAESDSVSIDGKRIKAFSQRDPGQIPWNEVGAEIVIESTGFFTDGARAKAHLNAKGVKKVLISAPAKNEDVTLCLGVNEGWYDPAKHTVISNGSCTTNCLSTVAKVLNDTFGIDHALLVTVHAYTNDQRIQDQVHEDPRRARAAAINIVPTTTGAARAVSLVIPELKGKFHGYALRVPVSTVSVVDLTCNFSKDASVESINAAFKAASEGKMKGILGYTEEQLVSVDFKGDSRSSIVDAPLTISISPRMAKVVAWYDNEWGYSCRLGEMAAYIASKGL